MALEGTLRDFSLADIFQLIGIQRKTGILTLKNEDDVVTVSFVDGSVVAADSYHKRLEDQLGNVLVKAGHITELQLQEALKIQRNTLQRLGRVLIDSRFIRPEELRQALQLQVTQIIYRLFRWKDGEYHFSQEEKVEYDRENFTPISAENILMEGVRMIDEWPIIEKKVRSLDMVFCKAEIDQEVEIDEAVSLIEEDMDFHLGEQESQEERSASADSAISIRLSTEEGRIYNLVDGRLNVQAIVDRSRMSEFDVCRVLYELLNRHLIIEATVAPSATRMAPQQGTGVQPLLMRAAAVLLALWCVVALARMVGAPRPLWPLADRSSESWSQIRTSISRSQIERLAFAIKVYYLAFGASPDSLESLIERGLARQRDLYDPWGRPYHFLTTQGGYILAAYDDSGTELDPELTLAETLPALGVIGSGSEPEPIEESEIINLPQTPGPIQ
ncbi:MAG: DUF4388 domain-containing protein [Acidobacteriota bacterium]